MKYTRYLFNVAFILLLGSCSFMFPHRSAGGILRIELPAAKDVSRSLGPDIDFFMTTFDISGSGPNGASFEVLGYSGGSLEKTSLALGTWEIVVQGKNSQGVVIGNGRGSVEVMPSSIAKLTIELAPLAGKGNLDILLDIQENALAGAVFETALLGLDGVETSPVLLEEDTDRRLKIELDTGFYVIRIRAVVDAIPVWGIEESVIILKDLPTAHIYVLDSAAVNKPPAAPSGLSAVWNPDGKVELEWRDNSVIETGMLVERRCVNLEEEFQQIERLRENSIRFEDTGPFERGESYVYRIKATHPRGNSAGSNEAQLRVPKRVEISGKLLKTQTWTSGNEYLITESTLVQKDMSLYVEPGVIIQFEDPGNYLKVDGTLVISGTAELPVRISGMGDAGWQGIKLTASSSGNRISHAVIRNGSIAANTDLEIRDSELLNTSLGVSSTQGRKVVVLSSVLNRGISISDYSIFEIRDSEISNPGSTAVNVYQSQIALVQNLIKDSNYGLYTHSGYSNISLLSNSLTQLNYGICLDSYYGYLEMDSNEIASCGVAINARNYLYSISITNNYLYKNSIGIYLQYTNSISSSKIQGNVFTGTTGEATVLLESCSSEQLHSIPFDKNTFHNPEAEFEVKLKDDVRGSYSILDMRNNFWGTTDLEAIQSRIRDSEAFFELCTVDFDPPAEAVPLTATPTYPGNGSVSGTSAPELGWKVNGWSPTFKVELSRSDTFNDLLFSKEGITERRFSLLQKELKEVFVDGETIWWRVTPESSSGSYLNPSAPSSFKIMLASPVLSSPSNGERLYQGWNPLLEWAPTEYMSSYFVQIDDDEDFSSPVVEGKSLSSSYQTPFILPEGVTYHWRVRGLDRNETTGPWSDVWSFRIPLPGLGVEITDILPVKVDLNIQGPDTLYTYQSTGFSVLSNVVPTETRWYLNAEDLGTMNTCYWPSRPIGYYTLTAMIQYGGRWYSVSKIVEVKADRGGTL